MELTPREIDGYDDTSVAVQIIDSIWEPGYTIKVTANPHWYPHQSAELTVEAARALAEHLQELVHEAYLMSLESDADAPPAMRLRAQDALTAWRIGRAL